MAKVRKAIAAALSAGATALAYAWPDGLTANEIGGVVSATVIAGLVTYGVRNAPNDTDAYDAHRR